VHRRYPESFRAILHCIDKQKCQTVNCFEEIQTETNLAMRWYDSDEDRKKAQKPLAYMPNMTVPFEILPNTGIFCERITSIEEKDEEKKSKNQVKAKTITMRIFSYKDNVDSLKLFILGLIKSYQAYMNDEVDKNQYYFITRSEKIEDKDTLLYDQFEFVSTRTFENIFFEEKFELKRRLDFFLNNQAWYQQRGVPYTLGFLFYGPPGTGKTSTIKAIANYTKRHLVEISLSRIKTYKELQKVFHDTLFCEKTIPHSKMIYLIEDIDCLDDIVKQRQTGDVPEVLKKKKKEKDEEGSDSENSETEDAIAKNLNEGMKLEYAFFKSQMKAWNKDPVTLSHILNLIDGLLECHGRILVITTNHPEKLDSALIRPGRVDMRVNFDVCSREDTVNIVEMFFFLRKKFQLKSRSRSIIKNILLLKCIKFVFKVCQRKRLYLT